MKKFGLVMAVIFILCALGTQPVSAQEPEYGYVPLLSEGYDTSLPRELVSRESFERLLPRLMDAKAEGIITDFEPDFFGGFVRVTSPSATLRGGAGAFPVKAEMWDAIVRPPTPNTRDIQRTATISIELYMYSRCFIFSGAGAGTHIKGTISTSAGELLGAIDAFADGDGYLYDCFVGDGHAVPGYKVTLKRFNPSTEVQLSSHTLIVPRTTFKSFTKSDALVSGTATPNLTYTISWFHPNLDAGRTNTYKTLSGTVAADGKWAGNFTGSFRGSDSIYLYLKKGVFSIGSGFAIPFLDCRLRTNYCTLYGLPKKPVELTIKHGGILYRFTGTSSVSGYFYGALETAAGDPILLSVGDRITGTDTIAFNLPALTMSVNRLTDRVSGKAPPNKFFEVAWYGIQSSYTIYDYVWAGSGATGDYTAIFPSDIPDSGFMETDIYYTDPATGNVTSYWKYFQ